MELHTDIKDFMDFSDFTLLYRNITSCYMLVVKMRMLFSYEVYFLLNFIFIDVDLQTRKWNNINLLDIEQGRNQNDEGVKTVLMSLFGLVVTHLYFLNFLLGVFLCIFLFDLCDSALMFHFIVIVFK